MSRALLRLYPRATRATGLQSYRLGTRLVPKRHEQGSGACGLQPPPSGHEAAEATRAVHRVFGINSTHAFGRDCRAAPPYLTAHVRSGDVFQGNWDKDGGWMPGKVHPGYGQPVLSYYVQCVAAA